MLCSESRSTSGRYTSRRCCSKTWSKFPTGWCRCTPNTNRSAGRGAEGAAISDSRGAGNPGLHALEVELPPRAHRRIVARRQRQALEEARLETRSLRASELDRPRGRAQHDHRLEAGDVVEEPAARGEHPQCVALELEEPVGLRARAAVVGTVQPLAPEARDGGVRRVEDGAVRVARGPGGREERAGDRKSVV